MTRYLPKSADLTLPVRVGLALHVRPPLLVDQIAVGVGGRRGGPIAPVERRGWNPVSPFPESPHQDPIDRRLCETDPVVVDNRLGLRPLPRSGVRRQPPVPHVTRPLAGQIEFRNADRQVESCASVSSDFWSAAGSNVSPCKCPCTPIPPSGHALIEQLLNVDNVVVQSIPGQDVVVVQVQDGIRDLLLAPTRAICLVMSGPSRVS